MKINLNLTSVVLISAGVLLSGSPEVLAETNSFQSNIASGTENIFGVKRILSSFEFWLSVFILVFGVFVIFVQYLIFRSNESQFKSNDILRTHSITIILIGGLLFVTASYDAEQIAPAVGLFGTIAGYLLGKAKGDEEK